MKSSALKNILFTTLLFILMACVQETSYPFDEVAIEKKEPVNISVIYPKLDDASEVSSKINAGIESTLIEQIAFFEEDTNNMTLNDAITEFENRFVHFKNDFEAEALPWEVNINGEVVLQSVNVITIAIDSYTFTGGAHGNGVITLLNFNPKTGGLYTKEDLIKNFGDLSELVKTYFKKELAKKGKDDSADYFFGNEFKLPDNIGFNEEGVIFLYNTYEMSSFADGITEFTIPYNEISKFLKISR